MNEKEQDIALSFSTDTNFNAYYSSPTVQLEEALLNS
jgi:hypothetical protein